MTSTAPISGVVYYVVSLLTTLNLVLDKTCYFHLAGQQTQVSESPTACPLQAGVWFTSQRTDLQSYCISAFVGRSCLGYGLRQSLSSPSLSSSLS